MPFRTFIHRSIFTLITLAVVYGAAGVSPVYAQQLPVIGITLKQRPEVPQPNMPVEFRAESYYFDMERAMVTWFVDGVQVKSARGALIHTVLAGPIGSATVVEVRAVHPDGKQLTKTVVLRPTFVGLVWEAQTYAPPLFKGKRLHTPGSEVTVTALPVLSLGSSRVDPAELRYTWYVSGSRSQAASGFGNQSFTTTNIHYLRPLTVSVEVQNVDASLTARGEVTIPVAQPELVLYEQHPLRGLLLGRALGTTHRLRSAEFTVVAEPYFVSAATREASNLEYAWNTNGTRLNAKSRVTLRPEGQGSGTTDLVLVLKNTEEILQSGRQSLRVQFSSAETERNPFTQ